MVEFTLNLIHEDDLIVLKGNLNNEVISLIVSTYDFLEYVLASNYKGVIGIDFLNQHNAVINFGKRTITLQ